MFVNKLVVGLMIFASLLSFKSQAQTQLELAAGSGTSTNGLTTANQTATFLNNTSGSVFAAYTPSINVTVSLSNQQYSSILPSIISTTNAMNFGGTVNSYGNAATSVPNFSFLNAINSPSNSSYTSNPNGPANSGIDVAINQGFYLYNSVHPLFTNSSNLTGRFYYGDLTITFNQPVSNPVLHIVGLGANTVFSASDIQGFTTELELQNSNIIASKLSGTSNFDVTNNKITNNSTTPNFICGSGAACGSVKIEGTNITSLTFKIFVRGDGNGTAWSHVNVNAGDEWMLSVSLNTPVTISGNVFNDANGLTDNTVNGIGTNASNSLFVNLVDTANKVVQSVAVNNDGTYNFTNIGEGNYTLVLSTTQGVQGSTSPTVSLPTGFVHTGENLGTAVGNDGIINGILPITVGTTSNIINANFGIYNCPIISNPSVHQTICVGTAGSNITVQTNTNVTNAIRFVRFASNPIAGTSPTATELAAIYAGTTIATVTPTGSSPNYTATYTWNSNDFINNTNTPITYYVYAISNPNAGSTCQPYQEIKVTVNPLPTIAAITGTNTLCVGSTTTLNSLTPGGIWSSSNNSIATINASGVVTGINAGNATITYTVTNSNGCTSAITYLVTAVSPASLPTITANGPTTACLGGGLALSSSVAASYQWFKDGVAIVGATNQTYTPTVSGTYTMVIISGGGACNAISNAILVVINHATKPSIAPSGDTVIICSKNNDKLCPATWGYSNYQWYKNGVAIASPTGTASCLYPTTEGTYWFTAQNGAGCWSMPSDTVFVKIDTICSGNVTGGAGGGVETKPLGDVIAMRLYGNAINNKVEATDYNRATSFVVNNNTTVLSSNSLSLQDILPATVANTTRQFISSPTDIVNFTNAVDVLSVDYLNNNTLKAVAFGTKTLGEVYSHTKPICDRLKEAELLEVRKTIVNNLPFIASKLKQRNGQVEYNINFSIGVNRGSNTFSLQSNWLTDNFSNQDTLFNIQIWAASYQMAENMLADVLKKVIAVKPIVALAKNTADLPKTYMRKVVRDRSEIQLTIVNATSATNASIQIQEKQNELALVVNRSIPITIAANGTTNTKIAVNDNYEHNLFLYINNKLIDLVYNSDGTWSADYNKANSTLTKFVVTNEGTKATTTEYPLYRKVVAEANTNSYISAYKLIKGGGVDKDLSSFSAIKFDASATGTTNLKVTLIKAGIINWDDQYSQSIVINGISQEYALALDKFVSKATNQPIKANDITAIVFTWENNRGSKLNIGGSISNARFTNDKAAINNITLQQVQAYPNPSTGQFMVKFISEDNMSVAIKLIDVGTGKLIETKFVNVKKGENNIQITTSLGNQVLRPYVLQVEGDGTQYKPIKLFIGKVL